MLDVEKKYILITGVGGLLGSRLADWLVDNKPEYDIVGIDNFAGGYIENVNKNVICYKRSIGSDDITDIFEKYKFEYVFHFAAYAAEGLSYFIPVFNEVNNTVATTEIVKLCILHKVKRLIFTSSMSVYGHGSIDNKEAEDKSGILRFDETDIPHPIDPYAISKFSSEQLIQVMGEHFGLDWCIIRPHNCYGVKQNIWDKYRNVLGIWMYQALHNEPMLVYGDGEQVRAFSYIDDCLEPFWNAAYLPEASREIINVGGQEAYTINEALEIMSKVTGYDLSERREARHEVKYAVPTVEKSIRLLNYRDNTSLEEGLTKMWEWAKTQPDRRQYKWETYEITEGIYQYWK